MTQDYDIIIIGAGIAGATLAARLVDKARVLLLERESHPAYHTTGRSAALFLRSYGPAPVRALTRASEAFFHAATLDPQSSPAVSVLTKRQALTIANNEQLAELAALQESLGNEPGVRWLDTSETLAMAPFLRRECIAASLLEPVPWEIDVHTLLEIHLKHFRGRGGVLETSAHVKHLERHANNWQIRTDKGSYSAPTIVNAAGAWAAELGLQAGAMDIKLVPKRRTAILVEIPNTAPWQGNPAEFPIIADASEQFYMKSDSGRLLISPADETPSAPCDAQPEELDIAICVDRIERHFQIDINRIQSAWAGLRSFVPDKSPVCGFDPQVDGFFWLAGQGGYGIQTAPALSQLAANLVCGEPPAEALLKQGFDTAMVSPLRLQQIQ